MSFGRCPYCSDEILLPDKAAPFSRVQCPLCREEFVLSEVLDRMPPQLIVLDAEDSEDSAEILQPAPASLTTIAPDASSPEDFKIAPLESDQDSSGPEGSGPQKPAAPVQFAINAGDDYEEQPTGKRIVTGGRNKKNPLVEVVKIVLGGVAGISIALLILLWLPGKWQRDPFKIGPKIGQYAPFMVPANFRPGWKAEDDIEFDENAADDAGFAASAKKFEEALANAESAPEDLPGFSSAFQHPSDPADDSSAATAPATSNEAPPLPGLPSEPEPVTAPADDPAALADEPAAPQPVDPLSAANIQLDLNVGAKPAPAKPEDASSESSDKPAAQKPKRESEEAPEKKTDKAEGPSVSHNAAALQTALETLAVAQQAFVAADEGKLGAAADYYHALASLGEVLAAMPDDNNDDVKQTLARIDKALGPQVLQEKKFALAIRDLGLKRLAEAESGGVALIGSIQAIEESDGLFLTTLKLFSSEKTVTLLHQQDPRQRFAAGARVVVVGELYSHAEEASPEFSKGAPPAVLHSRVVVLAK